MSNEISSLMFFTLAVTILIVGGGFLWFMRKRSNRHPMDGQRERNLDEIREDGPTT